MLFPRNLTCGCGLQVAFDPDRGQFRADAAFCANRAEIDCNWIADSPGNGLCRSCGMTEVVPETFRGENRELWAESERAKRWVLSNLARWGWFLHDDPGPRPVFHMLAEDTSAGPTSVTMGHAGGLVTINVAEANPATRVERREAFGEPLRTMAGHFRHELGHYFFFERLSGRNGFIDAFRARFGDERADYAAALGTYYADGPCADWAERHVTSYAACHSHEDWAESFANLLHLTDIVDSVAAVGLQAGEEPPTGYDAYAEADGEALISHGVNLGVALNHVNRAMGHSDLYPFVLSPEVRAKLVFVHEWMRTAG